MYLDVANYESLPGSSYIILPPELNNLKKGLLNLKDKDNECFKWCQSRFLHPQDKHHE